MHVARITTRLRIRARKAECDHFPGLLYRCLHTSQFCLEERQARNITKRLVQRGDKIFLLIFYEVSPHRLHSYARQSAIDMVKYIIATQTGSRSSVKIRELQNGALDRELIQRHRITVEGRKGGFDTLTAMRWGGNKQRTPDTRRSRIRSRSLARLHRACVCVRGCRRARARVRIRTEQLNGE